MAIVVWSTWKYDNFLKQRKRCWPFLHTASHFQASSPLLLLSNERKRRVAQATITFVCKQCCQVNIKPPTAWWLNGHSWQNIHVGSVCVRGSLPFITYSLWPKNMTTWPKTAQKWQNFPTFTHHLPFWVQCCCDQGHCSSHHAFADAGSPLTSLVLFQNPFCAVPSEGTLAGCGRL